jgi:hypothetical protein
MHHRHLNLLSPLQTNQHPKTLPRTKGQKYHQLPSVKTIEEKGGEKIKKTKNIVINKYIKSHNFL